MFGISKTPKPTRTTKTGKPAARAADAPIDGQPTDELVSVSVELLPTQREKLIRLGGAEWIRERIDKAREPK